MKEQTYIRVILAGVCTTRLLTSGSGGDSLNGTLQEIAELKGLNEVTIEG